MFVHILFAGLIFESASGTITCPISDGSSCSAVEHDSSTLLQSKASVAAGFSKEEKEKQVWTEVVVAHYAEDLDWISDYARPDTHFTVYSKADKIPEAVRSHAKLVHLHNLGREGHTYLHHIVHNYDNLAPWTVFKQGSRPTQGYLPTEMSGHLNSGVVLDDYLQPFLGGRDSLFVMTAAAHFPSGLQLTRPGLAVDGLEQKPSSTSMCPSQWTPWWFEMGHIYARRQSPSMLEFHDRFVARFVHGNRQSKSLMVAFPQGGMFAVSRARIHTRPRDYYASLLDQVKGKRDPIQGYWLEALWYDIFHPEALQSENPLCKYPPMPETKKTPPYRAMIQAWVQTTSLLDVCRASEIPRHGTIRRCKFRHKDEFAREEISLLEYSAEASQRRHYATTEFIIEQDLSKFHHSSADSLERRRTITSPLPSENTDWLAGDRLRDHSCDGLDKATCAANTGCGWSEIGNQCHIEDRGSFDTTLADYANSSLPRTAHMPS
jgi:hypothetical protein